MKEVKFIVRFWYDFVNTSVGHNFLELPVRVHYLRCDFVASVLIKSRWKVQIISSRPTRSSPSFTACQRGYFWATRIGRPATRVNRDFRALHGPSAARKRRPRVVKIIMSNKNIDCQWEMTPCVNIFAFSRVFLFLLNLWYLFFLFYAIFRGTKMFHKAARQLTIDSRHKS